MNNEIQKKYKDLAQGSIYDTANTRDEKIEEVFAKADVVVMFDISSSMSNRLSHGETRHDVAVQQLRDIQRTFPGRVVLIEYNNTARIQPSGLPTRPSGGTQMSTALDLAFDFDGLDTKFYLISDGEPQDEQEAYDWAASFTDSINTIFIGEDHDLSGLRVMNRIAELSGGEASGRLEPKKLAGEITRQLTAGK